MILMNKFIRIYSYFPYIILMLMFRLLLYGEELVYAGDTENTSSVDLNSNGGERKGGNVAEIFIAVIYPKSKETVFSRVIKQTVTSLSEDFTAATNLRVVPHYTAIADSEGYNIQEVEEVCNAWNHKPIIAVVVFSSFKSGFGHVLTSLHNNVPVLWATGEVQPGYFERVPLSRFDVRLDPGSHEVLRSLRSLLLATHWHAFTIMHTTNLLASRVYQEIISQAPLLPTILQFRPDSTTYYIFRLLSDVSKSTKGVVVLICEGIDAKRVIEESKKLNMVNGDFVWLWIDTSAILIKDKNIRLDKPAKEMNFIVETRKVRHAPNFYVNQSKANVTTNYSKKTIRNRDNNLPNVGDSSTSPQTPVFCNTTNRVTMYENKTDIKNIMYNNVINMNNEILPNVYNKDASFSALMKHHFSLYRKKAWRIEEKIRQLNDEPKKSAALMNKAPRQLNAAADTEKAENATLYLSVINEEPINRAYQPINDNKKEKRFDYADAPQNATLLSTSKHKANEKYYAGTRYNAPKNFTLVQSLQLADDTQRRYTISASTVQNRLVKSAGSIVKRKARPQESYTFDVPVFADNNATIIMKNKTLPAMPVGILALQLMPSKVDKNYVKSTLKLLINTLKDVIVRYGDTKLSKLLDLPRISCFDFIPVTHGPGSIIEELTQNLKRSVRKALAGRLKFNETHLEESSNTSVSARFKILNLVPEETKENKYENKTALESRKWRTIGHMIGEDSVHLETIVWPGGDIIPVSTGRGSRSIFRIVTAFAPPFVMIGELDEDGQCLRGIECHQFLTSDKDNLTLLFNEMERTEEEEEVNALERLQLEKRHMWDNIDIREHHPGRKFKTNCCYGLSMDLLENVAEELEFDFQLYIVSDGLFGTKTVAENGEQKWNGIVGDLVSGAAHLSFSALSVSSSRAQAIDFSVPYFFSGVSFLAAPKESSDIPLLAFLLPFSSNLWIAIFTSLHVTAAAVAIYEWLSPFGLNPWGRQRSKNFGVASALWVMWGLLCGHLVQFKAPKSWPNKFLINVWGGFSVIFIASYTANIAALIAGLFFHNTVGDHHDRSLLSQRVGAPKASAAEYYVKSTNQILWDHMQRYSVISVAEGVQLLKNGSLDILIADTPILDYYRATDHGCKLQRIGDTINEDTYAIGMTKGFPLKDSISAVIAKYASNGYMDILQEKWYGGLPCFKLATDMAQPRPLGVAAVAGVFLMLGCGVVVGCLILFSEHLFYKYTLPSLRKKPKSSIWKSRNVMFFSQKLYRFINCVELVSPHHAARELVHTLRQGQITSLFQKSVRRELFQKEHEQRQQQQKSKAQFFEMIQEIRRVQQEERKDSGRFGTGKISPRKKYYGNKTPQILLSPTGLLKHRSRLSPGRLDFARRLSKDVFRSKSSGNLDVRRISSDFNVAAGRFFDFYSAQAIGRRLSHGTADNSPPDMNARRASQFLKDDSSSMNRSPSGSDLPENVVENKIISSSPSDTNLVKSPKSPTSIPSSSVSSNVFSPGRISNSFFSRDIGPLAARKFSNVDSSSFRGLKNKIPNKINTPKLTINNEEFFGLCEGANCDDYRKPEDYCPESKPIPTSRNSSVKSTEHIIEIVIPSETGEDAQKESCEEKVYRHCGTDSEPELRAFEDTSPVSEDYDSKPKIILHLPKKKKNAKTQCSGSVDVAVPNKSACDSTNATSPLQRLSKDELVLLSQLSEKDLKENLLKALEEKDPT